MKTKLQNQKAEQLGQAELPDEIFALAIKRDLVQQAVMAHLANSRQRLADSKDRSQVRGGGRKPWRQKGTGRARHGSIRSPIWIGGGVTFGPNKEKNFTQKINKKMKKKALLMGLSSKVQDQELILIDKLELTEGKTKELAEILNNLKIKESALLVLPKTDQKIVRASRNLPKVKTSRADSLNIFDVLKYKYLLISQTALEVIKKTYGSIE